MIEALARQAEKQDGADKIHSQLNNTRVDIPLGGGSTSGSGSMLDQLGKILQQEGGATLALTGRPTTTSQAHKVSVQDEILPPGMSTPASRQTQSGNISSKDLDSILKNDRARVQQSPGGGLFGKLLDQDGDGDFDMNDMLKIGMSMLFKK